MRIKISTQILKRRQTGGKGSKIIHLNGLRVCRIYNHGDTGGFVNNEIAVVVGQHGDGNYFEICGHKMIKYKQHTQTYSSITCRALM